MHLTEMRNMTGIKRRKKSKPEKTLTKVFFGSVLEELWSNSF